MSRVHVRPYARRGQTVSGYEQTRPDARQTQTPTANVLAYDGIAARATTRLKHWEGQHALMDSHEEVLVVSPSGAVLLDKIGEREYVPTTDQEQRRVRGGIFTHNHPTLGSDMNEDLPFSINDACWGISCHVRELRAVTAYAIYRLRPGPRGWPSPYSLTRTFWRLLRAQSPGIIQTHSVIHTVWQQLHTKMSDYLIYERIPHDRLARITPPRAALMKGGHMTMPRGSAIDDTLQYALARLITRVAKLPPDKAEIEWVLGVDELRDQYGWQGGTMDKSILKSAPPGREEQVRRLKEKFPGEPERAFAIAWASYNKKHRRRKVRKARRSAFHGVKKSRIILFKAALPGFRQEKHKDLATATKRAQALRLRDTQSKIYVVDMGKEGAVINIEPRRRGQAHRLQ